MGERPMTKMSKCLAVALTAVILAAGLAETPAGAAHNPRIFAWAAEEVPGAGNLYSNDGGSTWTATEAEYRAGEADAGGDNGDGPSAGTFQCCQTSSSYSSDAGSTWTATMDEYRAGEHDTGGDNGDGPAAGTYRARNPQAGLYSRDGGSTWIISHFDYFAGEADAGGDNGDGPAAGTHRYRYTSLEYSTDAGLTWTEWLPQGHHPDFSSQRHFQGTPDSIEDGRHIAWEAARYSLPQPYLAGEADAGGDNGDGPAAGTYRYRSTPNVLIYYICYERAFPWGPGLPPTYYSGVFTIRPSPSFCPSVTGATDTGATRTFTWNVDDGIEPTGDWCVTGRALADGRSLICRGEGYTYREARRELGFGLGRP